VSEFVEAIDYRIFYEMKKSVCGITITIGVPIAEALTWGAEFRVEIRILHEAYGLAS